MPPDLLSTISLAQIAEGETTGVGSEGPQQAMSVDAEIQPPPVPGPGNIVQAAHAEHTQFEFGVMTPLTVAIGTESAPYEIDWEVSDGSQLNNQLTTSVVLHNGMVEYHLGSMNVSDVNVDLSLFRPEGTGSGLVYVASGWSQPDRFSVGGNTWRIVGANLQITGDESATLTIYLDPNLTSGTLRSNLGPEYGNYRQDGTRLLTIQILGVHFCAGSNGMLYAIVHNYATAHAVGPT
jgi:hypothetical protein